MNIERATATPAYRILVEKDVDIPVRDGARLKADILRPDDSGKFPAILNLGPYQKDKLWIPPDNLEEKSNPLMNWETINPEWWVPKGYAAVRVDARGTGRSPGQFQPFSYVESLDFHDAIEWAARQPWCSGKVGLSGISYFAINQWFVANHQPPSLKAIIPWEGFADLYRDALFHGGILSQFMTNWFVTHLSHHLIGRASRDNPDAFAINTLWHWLRNSLDNGTFAGEQAQVCGCGLKVKDTAVALRRHACWKLHRRSCRQPVTQSQPWASKFCAMARRVSRMTSRLLMV